MVSMALFPPIPMPAEELSADALEWDKLRALVAGFAQSEVARDWLLQLRPSRDPAWIAEELDLVDETMSALRSGVSLPLHGLFDPAAFLEKARIAGNLLEPEEIGALLSLLDSIVAWVDLMKGLANHSLEASSEPAGASFVGLAAMAQACSGSSLSTLTRSLRSRFNPDGSLADSASPELRRIRGRIARQKQTISDSLAATLRRLAEGGEARDEIITIRAERFVIPVKAEFKRKIPGVVHGASSSGQTVYLEPLETIEQNNELVRLLEEEQRESARIYAAMTTEIGAQSEAIALGAAALARLDTLAARARFSIEFDCIRPRFSGLRPDDPGKANPAPELVLDRARHPLLENRLKQAKAAIVPISFALDDSRRQLIVTGPNTGGKTVVLKTAGLLALMAQSGIPVPAANAIFPVFVAFLADIGDAQSIELDLSTFSAHVSNLNHIAARAGEDSLVLLDELGSGTDPEEGAALAVAIAHYFLRRRCWCLISTHHSSLKVYGSTEAGVLNAAVGLDEQTLAPTYELRLGVPGASAGIHIARNLGLDSAIVAEARARLSTETRDIADFIRHLHEQLDQAADERAALHQREQEVALEKSRLDREGLKEWRTKVRELEKQMEGLFEELAFETRTAVRNLTDRASQEKLAREAERRVARLRREFQEQFNAAVVAKHSGADKNDAFAVPHLLRNVSPGDTVLVKSMGKTGKVLRQVDEERFEIAIGSVKVRARRNELAAASGSAAPSNPIAAARQRGISVTTSQPEELSSEINVIGRTADEAADEVDRYLDRAYLAGLTRIRIIHGIGMGILRKQLRTQLAHHAHVAKVTEAPANEGGAGATIVDLKA